MKTDEINPSHFDWTVTNNIATICLNRPDKKNPLTFDSYAELRDTFLKLKTVDAIKAVIFSGNGGNFCSGGDVHEIIGPLVEMEMDELLEFTRMTGDLVKAIRNCPQPVIAAVEGICAGAGACIAMAADIRYGTPDARIAFLFNRVGLAGCDMGACAILPRLIGFGRASELLFTGRTMGADEAERWGFFNNVVKTEELDKTVRELAEKLSKGPNFANGITKTMLNREWNMGIEEFIEAEAQAQALCMQTSDFKRAFDAFVAKEKPIFKGN